MREGRALHLSGGSGDANAEVGRGDKTRNLHVKLAPGGRKRNHVGKHRLLFVRKFCQQESSARVQPMSDRAVAIAVGVTVGVAIAVAVRRRSASDYNALAQAACAAEGKLARLAASAIRLTACVPGSE